MLRIRQLYAAGKLTRISSIKEKCVVCFNEEATFACVPCSHQVLCDKCVPEYKKCFKTCPLCRRDLKNLALLK